MRVLIADDEKGIRLTLSDDLRDAGFEVVAVEDGARALKELEKRPFDVLVSDIVMPGLDGLALLEKAKNLYPGIFAVMITGNTSDGRNRRAVALGANYYIEKPFNNDQIVLLLSEARRTTALALQVQALGSFQSLVGASSGMRRVFDIVQTVAESDFDVLITGANGTGKENVAKLIHANSPRSEYPFVVVHCSMYAETLIEDELFGHEEGAYTGASGTRIGRFERANKGSVFLDDIDDMPLGTQVKLLRVLQEREIERLGGAKPIPVDVRVIAATKINLAELVRSGKFREDLYYRLNVIPVELPPLSERHGDIPLLVAHFIDRYARGKGFEVDEECLAALERYAWPGNVRELENAVKRAIALSGKERSLKANHFLRDVSAELKMPIPTQTPGDDLRPLKDVVEAAERAHLIHILRHAGNNKGQAADILGISRKNLWEKAKKYGIEDSDES